MVLDLGFPLKNCALIHEYFHITGTCRWAIFHFKYL
jgi:hypothetical protein